MTENVRDLINNLLRAVEYEREAERRRHIEEIRQLSGAQREEKGRALIGLIKRKAGRALGGDYLYTFRKKGSGFLPDTQINVGDQVIISQFDPLDSHNPSGTVYEVTARNLTVSCNVALAMNNSRPLRLDLYVNDTTFQRMEAALTELKSSFNSKLQAILSGDYNANSTPKGFVSAKLNDVQQRAVDYALANNGYYSIQGPPGTGKTHTAAHLITEIVAAGQRVLVTADSNAAVDNILRKLSEMGHKALRIGNPIRVNRDLKHHTLDYKVLQSVLYQDYLQTEHAIELLKDKQTRYERPTAKTTRGLKADRLVALYNEDKQLRGLNKHMVRRFRPWLKLQLKIDDLYDNLREVKEEIQNSLLTSHRIICTTNSTAGSELLTYQRFDWVIIDEAAQASIPSSAIPILKGERFVLLGDHFQLPPVVLSKEAKELGLDQSLMDYLAVCYPFQLTRLSVQYRMHRSINNLVSDLFYDGQLVAHSTVRERKFDFTKSVIDLYQVTGRERRLKDSKSYYNEAEVTCVVDLVKKMLNRGLSPNQIAVISPYKAQVNALLMALNQQLEIDTVDAFQGREKDLVIISFVRSNIHDSIGFLSDYRRLNVSISRAKKKLIMVGDFNMLIAHPLFERLIKVLGTVQLVNMPRFSTSSGLEVSCSPITI